MLFIGKLHILVKPVTVEWQYSSSNISSGSNSSSSSNINSSSDSSRNMAVTVAVRVAVTVAVTFSLKVISEMVKPRKRCGWYSVVPQVDRTPSRFKFRAELSKDILGDGQGFKCPYILLCRAQPLKVTILP